MPACSCCSATSTDCMSEASRPSTGMGVRHYLSHCPVLQLYGWTTIRLPDWFNERFPAEYHRKRLFDEPPADPLHAVPFEKAKRCTGFQRRNVRCWRCSAKWGTPAIGRRRANLRRVPITRRCTTRIVAALHQRQNRALVPSTRTRTRPALGHQVGPGATADRQRPTLGVPLRDGLLVLKP